MRINSGRYGFCSNMANVEANHHYRRTLRIPHVTGVGSTSQVLVNDPDHPVPHLTCTLILSAHAQSVLVMYKVLVAALAIIPTALLQSKPTESSHHEQN